MQRYEVTAFSAASPSSIYIRTGRYINREKITDLLADRRFSYVILDGVLQEYEGVVELTPLRLDGTIIK